MNLALAEVSDSALWARLEDTGYTTVRDFVKTQFTTTEPAAQRRYLHDVPISSLVNGAKLLDTLTVPKYFASDYLQFTRPSTLYRDRCVS